MTKEITVPGGKAPREKPSQEKLQESLLLFQLMEKQLEALKQQELMVEARMAELENTRSALEEIGKLKEDNETLTPLGSGFYAKARVTGKEILTELGASVMLEKGVKEALSFLDEKKKELDKADSQIKEQAEDIIVKLNELGPELQRMAAEAQSQ
jgi:prefoldin alpha subunit